MLAVLSFHIGLIIAHNSLSLLPSERVRLRSLHSWLGRSMRPLFKFSRVTAAAQNDLTGMSIGRYDDAMTRPAFFK
jgi:hypothetical protein